MGINTGGTVLGGRANYTYTSDTGTTYFITTRSVDAAATGFTVDSGNPEVPIGMRPRHIWAETVNSNGYIQRRKFYVPTVGSGYWNGSNTTVSADGLSWLITGRVGEKVRGTNKG
jgi:hypothetical protein